jgi:hypothetical protein
MGFGEYVEYEDSQSHQSTDNPVGLENSMQCLTCGCGLPCSGEGVEDRVEGLS